MEIEMSAHVKKLPRSQIISVKSLLVYDDNPFRSIIYSAIFLLYPKPEIKPLICKPGLIISYKQQMH